jgi:hypothetical protein
LGFLIYCDRFDLGSKSPVTALQAAQPTETHAVNSNALALATGHGTVQFFSEIGQMEPVTLRARFDGKQIVLDEPFELDPNTELIVTVVPRGSDEEREAWTRLALESLARAYGADEPEYSRDQIKEAKAN